jgi:hypothetical protein
MKFNLLRDKEITDFEKEIGIELVVTEINTDNPSHNPPYNKYNVRFEDCDCMIGYTIYSLMGLGDTIDEAIADYCDKISGNKLISTIQYDGHGTYKKYERGIIVPKLKHTKLLGK